MKINLCAALAASASAAVFLNAATAPVANDSFENPPVPDTVPAVPFIESWQQTAKPDWYVEDPADPQSHWANLAGVFPNLPPGESGHIENMDGGQAAYIFAITSNGILQELAASYEIAQATTLTVGLVGSATIPPAEGSTLALSLYYRDAAEQIVTLASTNIAYTTANFPATTDFIDFAVSVPATRSTDPWAGRKIGVLIASTVAAENAGGIWDIDNVRVQTYTAVNPSFETPEVPTTVPALPLLVGWEHTPKPDWYEEDPEAPETAWANLVGVFPNPPTGSDGHIANLAGEQAGYIFAVPSSGIFQDTSAMFESGFVYTLTLGLVGSATIPPPEGSTLEIALYYRDSQSNRVTVATQSVAYSPELFPSITHLVDFSATTPALPADHPAVGRNLGIAITSTVAPGGGIWDVDNVRVTAGALRLSPAVLGDSFRITWPGKAGAMYQVEVSDDLASWSDAGAPVEGVAGETVSTLPLINPPGRAFYRVRVLDQP